MFNKVQTGHEQSFTLTILRKMDLLVNGNRVIKRSR